eukprot:scaffold43638_cov22-Tisochrysis_lutea.AAC.5
MRSFAVNWTLLNMPASTPQYLTHTPSMCTNHMHNCQPQVYTVHTRTHTHVACTCGMHSHTCSIFDVFTILYHASLAEAQSRLPFDSGFESVSIVAAVGPGVQGFAVGDPVATLSYDGFAEFGVAAANQALKVRLLVCTVLHWHARFCCTAFRPLCRVMACSRVLCCSANQVLRAYEPVQ